MNQQQRRFLIDKIEKSVATQIDILNKSKPDAPSLENYLAHAVLSGNYTIRSNNELRDIVLKKALAKKGDRGLLGSDGSWRYSVENTIAFKADEFFVLPDAYLKEREEFRAKTKEIEQEIRDLAIQRDSLSTRLQLASDKTLQRMIDEVDDMGDISLIDTTLKSLSLSAGATQKQIK